MELDCSSSQLNGSEVDASGQQVMRNNSRGIRVVGNRVYDPANGKTCHQCRQKTRDFAASCKNPRNGKPCAIKFCHKCLLNRYGEKAEEVEQLNDWMCPKCRGICNCSFCMKKRGQQPTGALIHTAKASGFKSVTEMLSVKASEDLSTKEATMEKEQKCADNLRSDKVLKGKAVSPIKQNASEKELVGDLSAEPGKENSLGRNNALKVDSLKVQKTSSEKSKKSNREGLKEISNGNGADDACQNKRLKRRKLCNGVAGGETKRNSNDERETEVDKNEKNGKGTVVIDDGDKNQDTVYGVKDGPEVWAAKDFFFDPRTLASNGISSNPNPCGGKEEIHQKTCNGTVATDNCINTQMGITQSLKVGKCPVNLLTEKTEEEIPLPPGTAITKILGIEFPPEDVGNALQFLEFCRVFGKALDVKKGEAEAILRELIRKQNLRHGQKTLVVQFQIRLLTLILTDSGIESTSLTITNGKNSWFKALEDLISESDLVLKEFPLDWLKDGISGYYELDLSKKLGLLNFICDEALGTQELRSYIDDENVRFAEEMKEARSKVAAAKEKERSLKQKFQDEMAKAVMSNGASLSISEHDALLSKIKSEAARAHTEMLKTKGTIPKRKQSSDAMRTEPEFLDNSGQTFWKLKSYNGEYAVLLQDLKIQDADAAATDERWFVYGPEQKDEIDKYISSRAKRSTIRKVPLVSSEISEANMSIVLSF